MERIRASPALTGQEAEQRGYWRAVPALAIR